MAQESSSHKKFDADSLRVTVTHPVGNNFTESEISFWEKEYGIGLGDRITKSEIRKFRIPESIRTNNPGLAFLILKSESLSRKKEKKEWFRLYKKCNDEQKYKLYDILLRELLSHQ